MKVFRADSCLYSHLVWVETWKQCFQAHALFFRSWLCLNRLSASTLNCLCDPTLPYVFGALLAKRICPFCLRLLACCSPLKKFLYLTHSYFHPRKRQVSHSIFAWSYKRLFIFSGCGPYPISSFLLLVANLSGFVVSLNLFSLLPLLLPPHDLLKVSSVLLLSIASIPNYLWHSLCRSNRWIVQDQPHHYPFG
jgi:hypothetical protein